MSEKEWISVDEKLPEIDSYVIVYQNKKIFSSTNERIVQYTKYGFDVGKVTHWIPLPPPPKEES